MVFDCSSTALDRPCCRRIISLLLYSPSLEKLAGRAFEFNTGPGLATHAVFPFGGPCWLRRSIVWLTVFQIFVLVFSYVLVENTTLEQTGSKHGGAERVRYLQADALQNAPTVANRWVVPDLTCRDLRLAQS